MKKRIYLTLTLTVVFTVSLMAQTTALVTYEGGYFVKNDKEWKEYRSEKRGEHSSYKQYKENDTYFYIKNKKCKVAIPKLYHDKIMIDREKNGKWEVVYNTLSVHLRCPESNGLFYTYRNHAMKHGEYDGYFVRDNLVWREYRPRMHSGVWCEYKQISEQPEFFNIESELGIVGIPKTTDNDIVIHDKRKPDWRGGYKIQAVYDRSATYMYNFYYPKYGKDKKSGFKAQGENARISLDNNGNIQLAFGGKYHDLVYTAIELTTIDGKDVILITIDKKNKIYLFDGSARIECKKIATGTLFTGTDSKDYKAIRELLKLGTFRM